MLKEIFGDKVEKLLGNKEFIQKRCSEQMENLKLIEITLNQVQREEGEEKAFQDDLGKRWNFNVLSVMLTFTNIIESLLKLKQDNQILKPLDLFCKVLEESISGRVNYYQLNIPACISVIQKELCLQCKQEIRNFAFEEK